MLKPRLTSITLLFALASASGMVARQGPPPEPVATFSILGYDPDTGEVGGAVQSRVFSVGNGVLWAEAEVGVVATQAIVDVSYGPKGLALLRAGMTPAAIVKALWESDPDPGLNGRPWPKEGRQFAVMDAKGSYAAFTGPKTTSSPSPIPAKSSPKPTNPKNSSKSKAPTMSSPATPRKQ